MIQISELKGTTIKKRLGAYSASFRYHNKNKQGGNFGINIYMKKEFNRATDKEICGYYDKEGRIWALEYGELYGVGSRLPIWALESLETLFSYLEAVRGWEAGNGVPVPIKESELLPKKEQLRLIGFRFPDDGPDPDAARDDKLAEKHIQEVQE